MIDAWVPIVSAMVGGATGLGGTLIAHRYILKGDRERRIADRRAVELDYQRQERLRAYLDLLVNLRLLRDAQLRANQATPKAHGQRARELESKFQQLTLDLTSAVARVQLIGGESLQASINELEQLAENTAPGALPDTIDFQQLQNRFVAAVRQENDTAMNAPG